MASANVDLVRSIFAAWRRGDFSSVDWAHPEIEFVLADGPDPGSWTGVPDMAAAWRARLSAFEGYRGEAEDYRELDDERVLVYHHRGGRGKASGLDIGHMGAGGATVFHLRHGKVTRLVAYVERQRALADLGFAGEFGDSR